LFDTVAYRNACDNFENEVRIEIDRLQEKFKELSIPAQLMETDDKGNVAIVFERINRAGVPLDTFQLLTAWSWSTEFDLQDKLDELSAELSEYGFDGLAEDQNLLIKCFTGYILGSTSPRAVMQLDGEKIRDNYEQIISGIKSSVDFLRKELSLYSMTYVPYSAMIVSLVAFFGTSKVNGKSYTEKQRKELVRWFWRSCFSRRYSSGVNDAHEVDIAAMRRLKLNESEIISDFKCDIPENFFMVNNFSRTYVNTKTFIAMLASCTPKSFISGANVDLEETLKRSNSKEFHHIFPRKHLQRLGHGMKDISCLANFCFLNNADNQKIKDKAPDEYINLIDSEVLPDILLKAICPQDTFQLDFKQFVSKRNKMLMEYANSLIK